MGTLSQMINPVLVRLGAGGAYERKGVLGGCLEGEHSHYKGQRQTVMLLHQPQIPLSLALSGFCFSCQENWQAAGMKKKKKKADQAEQVSNSEAMLRN